MQIQAPSAFGQEGVKRRRVFGFFGSGKECGEGSVSTMICPVGERGKGGESWHSLPT